MFPIALNRGNVGKKKRSLLTPFVQFAAGGREDEGKRLPLGRQIAHKGRKGRGHHRDTPLSCSQLALGDEGEEGKRKD